MMLFFTQIMFVFLIDCSIVVIRVFGMGSSYKKTLGLKLLDIAKKSKIFEDIREREY